jgi:hypothetical protein
MLGGYYLGQLYLGISGLPSSGVLSVVPSSHQLSSDNITLTQKHSILVDSTAHALSSENITLTQKHVLTVENAIHTLMSENVAITSEQVLGINDAFHGLTSTEIALTQKHTIVVDNTTHTVNSDNLDLVEHKTLVINNTLHGHTAQSVTLAVRSYLDVANALHSHTAQNTLLTQKHSLVVSNTTHSLLTDAIGGLLSIEPNGFGGGYGAIEAWGVKHFAEINIELPLNYIIIADDATHSLWFDDFDTFVQIFNMVRTGIYIKDFEKDGEVGEQYTADAGTVPTNNGYFGNLAPVVGSDNGFFMVEVGSSGSYDNNDINDGILKSGNRGEGELSTEVIETGIYAKKDNNTGEYEEI